MVQRYTHEGIEGLHYELHEFAPWTLDDDTGWDEMTSPDKQEIRDFYDAQKKSMNRSGFTLDEAVDLLENGWDEGRERIIAMKRKLHMKTTGTFKDTRRRRVRDDHRGNPDLNRILMGRQNKMFTRRQRDFSATHPIITLVQSIGGNAGRSAEELLWCGTACLVLTESLESAGYQVELVASDATRNRQARRPFYGLTTSVSAKGPNERIRIGTLAAMSAHAGVFRTLFFLAELKAHGKQNFVSPSYGHSESCTYQDQHVGSPVWRKGAICIPQLYNKKAVEEYILGVTKSIELDQVT